MRFLSFIGLLLVAGVASAQSPSEAASGEITQLFLALQNSKCVFSRNGVRYGGREAAAHLRRKYDYLIEKGMVSSAEAFIDLAATKSSMSGEAYLVFCGNAQPVASKSWFTRQLKEVRTRSSDAR